MTDLIETWVKIDGITGEYFISNLGRVCSRNRGLNRIMKTRDNGFGYERVSFGCGYKTVSKTVHSLVAEHFIGKRPKGMVVNHKDANKKNNIWTNLEWVTPEENMRHCVGMKLHHRGEKHHKSKLTEKDVIKIRAIKKETGRFNYDIGEEFGVSADAIQHIVTRKSWRHI